MLGPVEELMSMIAEATKWVNSEREEHDFVGEEGGEVSVVGYILGSGELSAHRVQMGPGERGDLRGGPVWDWGRARGDGDIDGDDVDRMGWGAGEGSLLDVKGDIGRAFGGEFRDKAKGLAGDRVG